MRETINLTEWKAKKEICELFQISVSLYKLRLNELKSSSEYSGYTKTLNIDSNPNSKKKTTKRFIHESVLDRFFSRRRVRLNDTDKTKKWSLNQKWDYFCHIVPEAINEIELKEKVQNAVMTKGVIVKINISQNAIMKATQNVMVNQTQNVFMEGIKCEGSKINITQKAVVDVAQNVLVQIVMNAMGSNPQFRQAMRQYNGDYNKNLLDEQIDKGVKIPEACMDDLKPTTRTTTCPDCEDCPICPQPAACNLSCPKCNDIILNATVLYGVVGLSFLILIIIIFLK